MTDRIIADLDDQPTDQLEPIQNAGSEPIDDTDGGLIPGIMGGATIVRIRRPDEPDLWYARYEYPPGSGQMLMFQFEDRATVVQTLGKDFNTSGDYIIEKRRERYLRRPRVSVVGTSAEITGQRGTFEGFMTELTFNAALNAGLRDPGLLGQFMSNPEIQNIIATGSLGDWTPERIQAEIRRTDFYQNELYPGISHFLSAGAANPEAEWRQYMRNVESALDMVGVARDDDGSYRQSVGELLERGVSDEIFVEMAPAFVKAQASGTYGDILNQWTQRELGKELNFDDLFDVFDGSASADLLQVVETANLQFAAEQEGVNVSANRLRRIAAETDLTEAQAQQAFNTVEQQLLALDRVILQKRYNITQGELIDAAAGIAPTSGRSIQEIRNLARKAAAEEGLLDDPKLQLFVGYNPRTGTPFRPGLNPLNPEGN